MFADALHISLPHFAFHTPQLRDGNVPIPEHFRSLFSIQENDHEVTQNPMNPSASARRPPGTTQCRPSLNLLVDFD